MTKKLCWFFLLLLMCGCQDATWEEHYERPDWLKGNAWEVLQGRGDFSIFLKAIEKSGFKDIVNGKGIVTVIAPEDEAFAKYLQSKNLSSIEQMDLLELKKLVGYHLVYYSFDKQKFANYQPNGFDLQQPALAGTFYKHRTRSRDSLSLWQDPVDGSRKLVFHKDRFVPVFSNYLFSSKGIEAKKNYEYFYPGSTWSGDGDNFNISNASVKEYAIPADNGYVYLVDQVVEPLETVYKELSSRENYSMFMSAYDRFTEFWYDEAATEEYSANGDSLFIVKHGPLPQIASEWSYNGEEGLPDYANLADLSYKAFNVFAPDNNSMEQFFEDNWAPYYTSINDVNFLPLALLLYNHVYQGSIVFPSEIESGETISSSFGTPIKFNTTQDVAERGIGVNGVYYGLNKVMVPDMFKSVTGPLLRDPKYKIFLYMMMNTDVILPLMSDALDFTLFVPSDEVILNTLYGESEIFWNEGNPFRFGDEAVEVENSEGIRVPMSRSSMELFVSNHVVLGEIPEITGKQVFRTRNPFSYIYVSPDGVAASANYNKGESVEATELPGDWFNGKAYEVNVSLLREEGSFKYQIASATSGTSFLHEFSEFSKLLSKAGLIETNKQLNFLFGDNFLLFAPSNEAITQALAEGGIIPEDNDELAEYLKYYFVPVTDNSLNDYPFPGFGVQGELLTSQKRDAISSVIRLYDLDNALQLESDQGEIANVISEFPKIYADGAIYQIDKVFKSK